MMGMLQGMIGMLTSVFGRLMEGVDEAVNPVMDRGAEFLAGLATERGPVKRLIRKLGDKELWIIKQFGPVALAGAIGVILPDRLFGTPQRAATVKNIIVRFITKVADAFEHTGHLAPEDVDQVLRDVMEEKVYVYGGHYHDAGCPVIEGRKNKRNEITIAEILRDDNPVPACAHCAHRTAERIEKAGSASVAKKPSVNSTAAVLANLSDTDRLVFLDWYDSLTPQDLKKVQQLLTELDSGEEPLILDALKNGKDPMRVLALLENKNALMVAKRELGAVGDAVEDKVRKLKAGIIQFDNSLQPAVAWSANKLQQLQQPPPPPPQRTGFVGIMWKVGGAFKAAGRWISETVFP